MNHQYSALSENIAKSKMAMDTSRKNNPTNMRIQKPELCATKSNLGFSDDSTEDGLTLSMMLLSLIKFILLLANNPLIT